jgi:hypothetical protein
MYELTEPIPVVKHGTGGVKGRLTSPPFWPRKIRNVVKFVYRHSSSFKKMSVLYVQIYGDWVVYGIFVPLIDVRMTWLLLACGRRIQPKQFDFGCHHGARSVVNVECPF